MSVDDIELRLGGLRLLPPRDGDSQAVNQASQSGDEAFAFRVQGGQPGGQLFKISTSVISKVPYLESIHQRHEEWLVDKSIKCARQLGKVRPYV